MSGFLYDPALLRLSASVPADARLDPADASVERRSPICGSRVAIDVRLDGAGRVAEMGHMVRACLLGQSSAALLLANAVGASPAELAGARDALSAYLAGTRDDPGEWPGLDIFAPARPKTARHASIRLAFEAAAEAAERAAAAWDTR